jgi:hypothetical protein
MSVKATSESLTSCCESSEIFDMLFGQARRPAGEDLIEQGLKEKGP